MNEYKLSGSFDSLSIKSMLVFNPAELSAHLEVTPQVTRKVYSIENPKYSSITSTIINYNNPIDSTSVCDPRVGSADQLQVPRSLCEIVEWLCFGSFMGCSSVA